MAEPLDDLDAALVRLRRLWRPVRRAPDGRQVDMSNMLVVEACARLLDAGAPEVSVSDVARFADVEKSTASRMVERAVTAGLVTAAPSQADARRSAVTLTPDGQRMRRDGYRERRAWLAERVRDWPAADVRELARLLARFAGDAPSQR